MKLLLFALVLLILPRGLSQQPLPANPPANPPLQRQMPPDTKAPVPTQSSPAQMSSAEIERVMQKNFDHDSNLANARIQVSVDEKNVFLSGTVESRKQHDLALQLAQSYAGERKIVDNLTIREKT